MPRGRTGQEARDDMIQRQMFDQYLEESAYETSRDEGTSGRHDPGCPNGHAPGCPNGHDTRGYVDSDRGGPRPAGSRHNYPLSASGPSRGHGGHHHAAMGGEDYDDTPDFSDDDSLADPRGSGARGPRGMGSRGNRRAQLDALIDSIPSDFRVPGPPRAGTRGQQRGGPGGSRYPDTSFDGSTEESTDDIDDDDDDDDGYYYPRGVGVAASAHRGAGPSQRQQEFPPHFRRGGMYQGGRSGSVDSVDSEAGLGGRNTSIREYGGQRAPGAYGRYDGGRDSDRRRF